MFSKTATKVQRKPIRVAAIMYRVPLMVTAVLLFKNGIAYPICPRCDCTIDREYMRFCDRCGQRLGWDMFDTAEIIHAPRIVER